MITKAIKAGIPLISISTKDSIYIERVLDSLTKIGFHEYGDKDPKEDSGYYTLDPLEEDADIPELYSKFEDRDAVLIFIADEPPHPMIFHAGALIPPKKCVIKFIKEFVEEGEVKEYYNALTGLNLKEIHDIIRLTEVTYDGITVDGITDTRKSYSGALEGLEQVSTAYTHYLPNKEIEAWAKAEKEFFLNTNIHPELVPRGLLLTGLAGMGKTLASKYVAKQMGVPLYRLDMSSLLDKYNGVSEANLRNALSFVDHNSPCILLIDEVEKVLSSGGDDKVAFRILATILWWLQEHTTRVITIMTANDLEDIPPALYRDRRLDKVIDFVGLGDKKKCESFIKEHIESLNVLADQEVRPTVKKAMVDVTKKLKEHKVSYAYLSNVANDYVKLAI